MSIRHGITFSITIVSVLIWATNPAVGAPDPNYWRLDDIKAQFTAWETAYPDIFFQQTLGRSGNEEEIPLVRISDNAATTEPEPRLLFHAAQHANEANGTGAIMFAIERLLTGYEVDPVITKRVNGLEILFVPIVNVDGHRYVFSDEPHWDEWRKTLLDNNDNEQVDFPDDGVDTNRNWDWKWDECNESNPSSQKYKGPFAFSEPETYSLKHFIVTQKPLLVVDYHSPVTINWNNCIFWPWMSSGSGLGPDADVATDIADNWGDNTLTHNGSHFNNLYAYDTLPKEQCWVYGNTGILTFLMEISDRCWWTGAMVDTVATRVARGSMYLLDRTLDGPGLTGQVTDADTGLPLAGAEVQINQMHADNVGPRLVDQQFGTYYRLTEPGSYTLTVSRRDYQTQTESVVVGADSWTKTDFELAPVYSAVESGDTIIPTGGNWIRTCNPMRQNSCVQLALPAGSAAGNVDLLTIDGRRVAVLGSQLSSGRSHNLTLPPGLPAGVYLVRAQAGPKQQVQRITLVR